MNFIKIANRIAEDEIRDSDYQQLRYLKEHNHSILKKEPIQKKLRERLLKEGGYEVGLEEGDKDVKDIVQRGQYFRGSGVKVVQCEMHECHFNASRLWKKYPTKYSIVTGYGLDDDGVWKQHSWLLDKRTKKVIETTAKWIAYFGVVFNDAESASFARAQYKLKD